MSDDEWRLIPIREAARRLRATVREESAVVAHGLLKLLAVLPLLVVAYATLKTVDLVTRGAFARWYREVHRRRMAGLRAKAAQERAEMEQRWRATR